MSSRLPILILTLGLTACVSTPSPLPESPATAIDGRILNWSKGANVGTVRLDLASSPSSYTTVATAPVDADGRFQLPLPSENTLRPLLGETLANLFAKGLMGRPSCRGVPAVTDAAARGAGFLALDVGLSDGTSMRILNTANAEDVVEAPLYLWVFADRPTHIQGSVTCDTGPDSTQESDMDLRFVRGWNIFRLDGARNGRHFITTFTTVNGSIPTWTRQVP